MTLNHPFKTLSKHSDHTNILCVQLCNRFEKTNSAVAVLPAPVNILLLVLNQTKMAFLKYLHSMCMTAWKYSRQRETQISC